MITDARCVETKYKKDVLLEIFMDLSTAQHILDYHKIVLNIYNILLNYLIYICKMEYFHNNYPMLEMKIQLFIFSTQLKTNKNNNKYMMMFNNIVKQ
jgi:hypothetical protein